jgi:hypothetical protein
MKPSGMDDLVGREPLMGALRQHGMSVWRESTTCPDSSMAL